jgi:hypothetical protein
MILYYFLEYNMGVKEKERNMKKFVSSVVLFVSGIFLMGSGAIGADIASIDVVYQDEPSVGAVVAMIGLVMAIAGGILILINVFKNSDQK